MSTARQCPKCGNMMCGAFGGHWNCVCGYVEQMPGEHVVPKNAPISADTERLGAALRAIREERGITMRQLSKEMHLPSSRISAWELGYAEISAKDIAEYLYLLVCMKGKGQVKP